MSLLPPDVQRTPGKHGVSGVPQARAGWRKESPVATLTCDHFQRLLADQGIQCSMSRSGNVWDNAAMESFFSSLKTERTARTVYRTRDLFPANVPTLR
ncbi:transposase (fragment) [Magnetospirillum sp. LM-5]